QAARRHRQSRDAGRFCRLHHQGAPEMGEHSEALRCAARVSAMIRTLVALVMLAVAASAPASAQSYPNRPVKLIVPSPAGGPIDVMPRLLAQKLSVSLGAVIVENRPGGGSTVGLKSVAPAEPDGYTFLFGGTMTLSVIPVVTTSPEAELIRRMSPVA